MDIAVTILTAIIIIAAPRLMVYLASRWKAFKLLGPVFLCYAVGLLLSFVIKDKTVATAMSEVMVPIAIPLILFGSDLLSLKKLAKPVLVSFALVSLSALLAATIGYFVFRGSVENADKIGGMLVGLYTGGTPNLMAIGMALGVPSTEIGLANTADLIAGGVYFAMLLSFMPKVFEKLLPPFKYGEQRSDEELARRYQDDYVPLAQQFTLKYLLKRVPAVLLAVACLAVAAGIAMLTAGSLNVAVVMLVVTTLGIALSFVKKVRDAEGSFASGQYFIYMFSLAIGISFDYTLINSKTVNLLLMLLLVQGATVIIHVLLARLAHIDAHTALITSTAGIYGPAFVVPVADAMRNRQVILPGLICGILGYGIGNYLGIGLAFALGLFA